jgi:hypothetical protein
MTDENDAQNSELDVWQKRLVAGLSVSDLRDLAIALEALKEIVRPSPCQDIRFFAEKERTASAWFATLDSSRGPLTVAILGSRRGQELVNILQHEALEPFRRGRDIAAQKTLRALFSELIPKRRKGPSTKYTEHENRRDQSALRLFNQLTHALTRATEGAPAPLPPAFREYCHLKSELSGEYWPLDLEHYARLEDAITREAELMFRERLQSEVIERKERPKSGRSIAARAAIWTMEIVAFGRQPLGPARDYLEGIVKRDATRVENGRWEPPESDGPELVLARQDRKRAKGKERQSLRRAKSRLGD